MQAVSAAELQRVHADGVGHFVDVRFAGEHRLRMPEPAHLAADR